MRDAEPNGLLTERLSIRQQRRRNRFPKARKLKPCAGLVLAVAVAILPNSQQASVRKLIVERTEVRMRTLR